jgi:hypothetical protein
MPEAQEVSPEGAPEGRSDPGGGGLSSKVGPLPLWGWGVALALMIGVVWYVKGRSSNTPTSNVQGLASGGAPPGDNSAAGGGAPAVSDPNGNKLDALLQAMQAQAATLLQLEKQGTSTQSAVLGDSTTSIGQNVNPAVANENNPFINTALHGGPGGGYLKNKIIPPYAPNAETSAQWQDYTAWLAQNPTAMAAQGGATDSIGASRILPPPVFRKKKRKRLQDILDIIPSATADLIAITTSHTSGGNPTQAVSTGPAPFGPTGYRGIPVSDPSYTGQPLSQTGGPPATYGTSSANAAAAAAAAGQAWGAAHPNG